jgi:hypothetical protein
MAKTMKKYHHGACRAVVCRAPHWRHRFADHGNGFVGISPDLCTRRGTLFYRTDS